MSTPKNVEKIKNEDGSELKVIGYDNHIVVYEKDAGGNVTGHTTDWFDNQIHVHDADGDRWEGVAPSNNSSGDSSSDSSNDSGSGCFITSAVCASRKKSR